MICYVVICYFVICYVVMCYVVILYVVIRYVMTCYVLARDLRNHKQGHKKTIDVSFSWITWKYK